MRISDWSADVCASDLCKFDENPFSNVLTFSYGRFKYYTGGDIPGVPSYNQPWWRDIETPVSAVVGPVDVMLLDHHGNRDTVNENILRNLAPRVLIQENWLSPDRKSTRLNSSH